jgi:hypothetical protein
MITTYLVKSLNMERSSVAEDRFRIFRLVDRLDAEDKTVQIKEEVGIFSLAELEIQKTVLENRLADLQVKIDTVKSAKASLEQL